MSYPDIVIDHLAALKEILLREDISPEASFGLVVLSREMDSEGLSVILEAKRFVDHVIVLYLPKTLDQTSLNALIQQDITAVFHPKEKIKTEIQVTHTAHRLDVTLLLQVVLAVMPVSVFIRATDTALSVCLKSVLNTFSGLFVLENQPASVGSLTQNQRLLRGLEKEIHTALQKGNLAEMFEEKMQAQLVSVHHFIEGSLKPTTAHTYPQYCIVTIKKEDETIREGFVFRRKKWEFWKKT